jgi:hypothetical protein
VLQLVTKPGKVKTLDRLLESQYYEASWKSKSSLKAIYTATTDDSYVPSQMSTETKKPLNTFLILDSLMESSFRS